MAQRSVSGDEGPDWSSAAVAGLLSALIVGIGLWVFDTPVVEEHIPDALGASGAPVGLAILGGIGVVLGLVYALVSTPKSIGRYVERSRTGGLAGLVYGLIIWLVAIVVVPLLVGEGTGAIGEIAVSARAAVAFALLGVLLGVGYLLVRGLRTRP